MCTAVSDAAGSLLTLFRYLVYSHLYGRVPAPSDDMLFVVFSVHQEAQCKRTNMVGCVCNFDLLLPACFDSPLSLSGTTGGGQDYRRVSSAIDAGIHAGWREANTPNTQLGIWANPYTLHSNSHPIVFEGYRSMRSKRFTANDTCFLIAGQEVSAVEQRARELQEHVCHLMVIIINSITNKEGGYEAMLEEATKIETAVIELHR